MTGGNKEVAEAVAVDDDEKTICSASSTIIDIEIECDDRDLCALMCIARNTSMTNNDDDCAITSIGSNNNDEEGQFPSSDVIVEVV